MLGVLSRRQAAVPQRGEHEGAAPGGEDARAVGHSLQEQAHIMAKVVVGLQQHTPGAAERVARKVRAGASASRAARA